MANRSEFSTRIFLTAKKGEIYGLLGPNGAGKTTTLRCIATLIKPTKGEVFVDQHEVQKEPEKVRESIGFLTSEIKLDEQFDVDYKGYNFKILSVVKKMIGSVLVRKLPEEKTPQNAEDGQSVLEEKRK